MPCAHLYGTVGALTRSLGHGLLTIISIPMVFISLHLLNAIAVVFGRMTRVMLGKLQ